MMIRKVPLVLLVGLLTLAGCDTSFSPPAGMEDPFDDSPLGQYFSDSSPFPDFGGSRDANGNVVDELDIESLARIGYGPVLENSLGLTLRDFGFRDVRYADLRASGWIETSTPGGKTAGTWFRTPEFPTLTRNLAYGLELRYKLKFPAVPASAPETSRDYDGFTSYILDARGVIRYALQYRPNAAAGGQEPDFVFYLGHPDTPSVSKVEIATGRRAPLGDPAAHVAIRLVLQPTDTAGGTGEIGLFFDASDGSGTKFYPVTEDSSGVEFTSLAFSFVTGADTYQAILLGLQFKLWKLPFEPDDTLPLPKIIRPGDFRTQTQGGWGLPAFRNNPGVYRNKHFAKAFPKGIEIGVAGSGGRSLRFTHVQIIQLFLPEGGKPAVLRMDLRNPLYLHNALAGQVLALAFNIGFDLHDQAFGASDVHLEDLVITSGTFRDWTVRELFDEANRVLGGTSGKFTPSQVNSAVSSVNANFINGTTVGPFLALP